MNVAEEIPRSDDQYCEKTEAAMVRVVMLIQFASLESVVKSIKVMDGTERTNT